MSDKEIENRIRCARVSYTRQRKVLKTKMLTRKQKNCQVKTFIWMASNFSQKYPCVLRNEKILGLLQFIYVEYVRNSEITRYFSMCENENSNR